MNAELFMTRESYSKTPSKVLCNNNPECFQSIEYGNNYIIVPNAVATTYIIGVLGEYNQDGVVNYRLSTRSDFHILEANRQGVLERTMKGKTQHFKTDVWFPGIVVFSATLISGQTVMKVYPSTNETGNPMYVLSSM